ncbi:monooxygenase FAD-binding protein [Kribbella flavida DSM 17836]|uniref:Monooxygenase FAD-binding protein n=1 Tax=Kribbella flavida (strain DSM 17836 / JCM 10339 / NBRC 14399) TaxID=479435 RepID=D2PQI5_KRIFD|nr:NAD(P)/FAD-dependent oxidoreductase [Kribbella flavida]ADB29172.1 monooxygenase FAD-binding protein [Kribbella flavida DSM 17836]
MDGLPEQVEVLVVGAGPAGLAAAATVASNGHQVAVVDKLAEGANTSRAAVIHARTLEMLEQLGVSDELVQLGRPAENFSIRDGDRELIGVPFGDLPTKYPYTLMIPQHVTERVLLDRLQQLGGRVHRPCTATGLTQNPDSATVTFDSGATIEARYVVAADGMHSRIRDLAGLGDSVGETLPLSFSLADVRVDGGLRGDQVRLYLATEGVLVVAPLPDGSFRLVAEVGEAPEHVDARYAQELLDTRGPRRGGTRVTEVIWGSRFRIHERVAPAYRAGRVVLAGDSAHTHSPAGGQGMNLGLRDAVTLGAALSTALKHGTEHELDQYATTARAEALQVVALAHQLTRIATAPAFLRPARNTLLHLLGHLPAVRHNLAVRLSAISPR